MSDHKSTNGNPFAPATKNGLNMDDLVDVLELLTVGDLKRAAELLKKGQQK